MTISRKKKTGAATGKSAATSARRAAAAARSRADTARSVAVTREPESELASDTALGKRDGGASAAPGGISFGGDNFAAVAAANAALMNGFEEAGREIANQARRAVEGAVKTTRALLSARDAAELFSVNRSIAQNAFEEFLANSARLSEIGIRTAMRAFAPFGDAPAR